MILIVEIEEFLKESRCHIVEPSGSDTVATICMPRQTSDQGTAADLVADDDLITWEDVAWQ